jgi:choline-glycine betaine transporter
LREAQQYSLEAKRTPKARLNLGRFSRQANVLTLSWLAMICFAGFVEKLVFGGYLT